MTRRTALAAGLLLAAAPAAAQTAAERSKGRADAPVVVYEMADFQCPACRVFTLETLPIIEREYIRTGRVRWVFINFPLSFFDSTFHRNAAPAHELAMCAARQGRFWPMHDALYQRQSAWAELAEPSAYFAALADTVGIERAPLTACLTQGTARDEVVADARRAYRAGGRSTPTFYVGGGLIAGAAPIATFRQILDSLLRVAPRRE